MVSATLIAAEIRLTSINDNVFLTKNRSIYTKASFIILLTSHSSLILDRKSNDQNIVPLVWKVQIQLRVDFLDYPGYISQRCVVTECRTICHFICLKQEARTYCLFAVCSTDKTIFITVVRVFKGTAQAFECPDNFGRIYRCLEGQMLLSNSKSASKLRSFKAATNDGVFC